MDLSLVERPESLQKRNLAEPGLFGEKPGWRLIPNSAAQVAELLNWADKTERPVALSPAEAVLLEQPFWLDMANLQQVRQYPADDFIIEVETGIPFGRLEQILSAQQQQFPLSYPPDATLLEILAGDRPALETGLRGLPRDYVLKTEIATPDGQLTISGADVVKNVTGYDLAKLYVGGRNAFGVLTSVTLKLQARPPESLAWLYRLESLKIAARISHQLLNAHLPLSVCEVYRRDGQWHLLAEMTGDAPMMEECRTVMHRLDESSDAGQTVDAQTSAVIKERLQRWPGATTVAEAAVPLSQWSQLTEILERDQALRRMDLQARPAAGLVTISGEGVSPKLLEALQNHAETCQGFLQVVRAMDWTWAGPYNLPGGDPARRLLKTLKNGYDPKGILFHPSMPL